LVLSLIFKKTRQTVTVPTVLSGVVVACLLFSFSQTEYNKTVSLTGDNLAVSGVITERPEFSRENRRYYCIIKADNVGGAEVNTDLRFSFSESYDGIDPSALQIGDRVNFSGTVYKTDSSSFLNYYKSVGIYLGAYSVKNFSAEAPEHRPIAYYTDLLRRNISDSLMHDFDSKNASFMVSLLTGNKDYLDDEMYDNFIEAGIVHIMAVSGLHLSVWVAFFSLFIDFSGKKGKLMAIIMIAFTVFMMNFASFTGSVKRAGAMTVLYFIGKFLGRKADGLNSLGFAAVCALLFNPFGALDISFLLSFLSTLGIILMGIPLSERLIKRLGNVGQKSRKLLSVLITSASLSLSVTLFVFPVSVIVLGGVSFASPLSNILTFFAVSPLLLLTGFYPLLRFIPVLSPFTALIMKGLSGYIIRVAEIMSDLPLAYVSTRFENLALWFMAAFGLLIIAMLLYKFDRVLMRATAIISAGVFLLSFSVNNYTALDKCKITVYGENRGSCAVVSLNGRGVLIGFDGDTYDGSEIAEDAELGRIKIDAAFFTESFISKDKEQLCETLGVSSILTSDGENAVLFDKVKIIKEGKNVTVDASEINTEIFLKEYLQDEDKYDTITDNGEKIIISFGEKSSCTVTVITSGGEKDG